MSVETKQCSICVESPPYRQCLAVGADECAYVVSLQAALREALDGWEEWSGSGEDADRIEFLRAQFLDDK